jgi:hypothetical protein
MQCRRAFGAQNGERDARRIEKLGETAGHANGNGNLKETSGAKSWQGPNRRIRGNFHEKMRREIISAFRPEPESVWCASAVVNPPRRPAVLNVFLMPAARPLIRAGGCDRLSWSHELTSDRLIEARAPQRRKGPAMNDAVSIAITLAFFVLAAGYVWFCEKIR